jgi:hypothetical protein
MHAAPLDTLGQHGPDERIAVELATRVADFVGSLADFKKPDHNPSWATGEIFNGLLAAAKEALPDDVMITRIAPAVQGKSVPGTLGQQVAKMDLGTMKAVMTQILSALGQTGPAFDIG